MKNYLVIAIKKASLTGIDHLISLFRTPFFPSDHSPKLDYDKMNAKFLRRSEELWTAIESSFWWQEQEEGASAAAGQELTT